MLKVFKLFETSSLDFLMVYLLQLQQTRNTYKLAALRHENKTKRHLSDLFVSIGTNPIIKMTRQCTLSKVFQKKPKGFPKKAPKLFGFNQNASSCLLYDVIEALFCLLGRRDRKLEIPG